MKIIRQIRGIETQVVAKKGIRGYYYYKAMANLKPEPVVYMGRHKNLSVAICSGLNRVSVGIRQMEEL